MVVAAAELVLMLCISVSGDETLSGGAVTTLSGGAVTTLSGGAVTLSGGAVTTASVRQEGSL